MAVKVRRRKERRTGVVNESALVGVIRHPEDDDVVVAFAGYRVFGVGAGVAEEDEGLAADLVDRLALGAVYPGDVRHRLGKLVDVRGGGWPVLHEAEDNPVPVSGPKPPRGAPGGRGGGRAGPRGRRG